MYRYEVNENNEVLVYSDAQEEAIIHQPFWPNGELFTAEEAEAWGAAKAAAFDDSVEYDAGPSREEPTVRKLTAEEIRIMKIQAAVGMPIADLKAALGL
jgi:hypothetical protein